MATGKKNNYISDDLLWLESRLASIKADVDSNPYELINDRFADMMGPKGITTKLIAKKEDQKKAYREALKEYAQLLDIVNNLREIEAKKIETRGGQEIGGMVESFLKNR